MINKLKKLSPLKKENKNTITFEDIKLKVKYLFQSSYERNIKIENVKLFLLI